MCLQRVLQYYCIRIVLEYWQRREDSRGISNGKFNKDTFTISFNSNIGSITLFCMPYISSTYYNSYLICTIKIPPPQSQTTPPPQPSDDQILAQKISKAINPQNPITRDFAVILASKYPGEYSVEQICSIYHYLYQNWKYVNDPKGSDYFASASESIGNGLAGDCDDFAITMSALIEAIGGTSRVVCAWGKEVGHAYAEVCFGNQADILKSLANKYKQEALYHTDKNGIWLNLDRSAKHPGGPFLEAEKLLIVYPDGRWERVTETVHSPSPPVPTLKTMQETIINETITIKPTKASQVPFSVDTTRMLNVQCTGTFVASGGTPKDVDVYIMNDSQYTNWINGHKAAGVYVSGRVNSANFAVPITTSDTYHLIFSNDFSIVSARTVSTKAYLSWQEYQK